MDLEETQEEFGWKMVHGDVFRSPNNRMILSVLIGNGCQILCMAAVTIVFAALGFLSPSNRGSLATVMIVVYVLFGSIAGYVSARVYKMCGGQAWKQNVLMTALLIPGGLFLMLLLVNVLFIAQNSSSAVPFGTLFALLALWFFLSIPLSFGGAFLGFTREVHYSTTSPFNYILENPSPCANSSNTSSNSRSAILSTVCACYCNGWRFTVWCILY